MAKTLAIVAALFALCSCSSEAIRAVTYTGEAVAEKATRSVVEGEIRPIKREYATQAHYIDLLSSSFQNFVEEFRYYRDNMRKSHDSMGKILHTTNDAIKTLYAEVHGLDARITKLERRK